MNGQMSLGAFAPPLDPTQSQYHTPTKLARRMVEWADVEGLAVLEPSAGGGNIVRELVRAGARAIEAMEIDPAWVECLRCEFADCDESITHVWEADFLKLENGFGWSHDVAVMNPPLNDGVSMQHVAKALELAPRVVTLLRGGDLHGANRYEFWKRFDLHGLALLCRRPPFGGGWHVGKTEFVVADIRRRTGVSFTQVIEHWPDDWA